MTPVEPPDIAAAVRIDLEKGITATVSRLRDMPPLEYDQIREGEAKRLKVRLKTLDDAVAAARGPIAGAKGQGQALDLPSPEPWPEPLDGPTLFAELTEAIRDYVVMEDGAAEAVAFWVVHAHCLDAFAISPRLAITSPEKRCGKTTCLDVIARLVPRPLPTSNTTAAAIFRTIELAAPTLLIDEADTFLTDNDEMRGVLNSGHRKSAAYVLRLVGDAHDPRKFSTWGAVAIAMIGQLPDTLEDRSIPVELRRRLSDERITAFRADRTGNLDLLARKVARWAADNFEMLAEMDPEMPPEINNRTADNWRALFAIADRAGGDWPGRLRSIAVSIAAANADDDQSAKIMILEDIRATFQLHQSDRLASADLVQTLVALEGRPWGEWRHGKPISQNSLARMLKPFKITSQNIRVLGTVLKGYHLEQFADAFSRYIPSPFDQTATPLQTAENQGFEADIKPLRDPAMLRFAKSRNPQRTAVCSGVAVRETWPCDIDLGD